MLLERYNWVPNKLTRVLPGPHRWGKCLHCTYWFDVPKCVYAGGWLLVASSGYLARCVPFSKQITRVNQQTRPRFQPPVGPCRDHSQLYTLYQMRANTYLCTHVHANPTHRYDGAERSYVICTYSVYMFTYRTGTHTQLTQVSLC